MHVIMMLTATVEYLRRFAGVVLMTCSIRFHLTKHQQNKLPSGIGWFSDAGIFKECLVSGMRLKNRML